MARWQCNSCGATYSDTMRDGSTYLHACNTEVVTQRAEFDDSGKHTREEKREQHPNPRNENAIQGIVFHNGKHVRFVRDPHDSTRIDVVDTLPGIVLEGEGRTLIEK
jgi:hypothetical protein